MTNEPNEREFEVGDWVIDEEYPNRAFKIMDVLQSPDEPPCFYYDEKEDAYRASELTLLSRAELSSDREAANRERAAGLVNEILAIVKAVKNNAMGISEAIIKLNRITEAALARRDEELVAAAREAIDLLREAARRLHGAVGNQCSSAANELDAALVEGVKG